MKKNKILIKKIIIYIVCICFFSPLIKESFAYNMSNEKIFNDLDIIEINTKEYMISKIKESKIEADENDDVSHIKNNIEVKDNSNRNENIIRVKNTTPMLNSNNNNDKKVENIISKEKVCDNQSDNTFKSRIQIINQSIEMLPDTVKAAYLGVGIKVELNDKLNNNTLGTFDIGNRAIYFKDCDEATKKSVVYHEFGHLIDFVYNNSVGASGSEEFTKIYEEEKNSFITDGNNAYCISSIEEYLAQSFSEYLCNPTRLKTNSPRTFEYVDNVIKNISSDMIIKSNHFLNNF